MMFQLQLNIHGGVAQLIEHSVHTRQVGGLNPLPATFLELKGIDLLPIIKPFACRVSLGKLTLIKRRT